MSNNADRHWAADTAASIRADLKAAQRGGSINPDWRFSVRTDTSAAHQLVHVSIIDMDLERMRRGGDWSDEARELAEAIYDITIEYTVLYDEHEQRETEISVWFAGEPAP